MRHLAWPVTPIGVDNDVLWDALESHDADLAHAAATVHVAGLETWIRSQEPGWSALAARAVHGT